jgi:hypothetical protein
VKINIGLGMADDIFGTGTTRAPGLYFFLKI